MTLISDMKAIVASQFLRVDDATAEARLAICKQCPSFTEQNTKCAECGCYMVIKSTFAVMHCPLKKWMNTV